MVALTYLIGMLAMLFTAFSYMRMSEAFPISGSVYSYAQRGINDFYGFLAGWIILLDLPCLGSNTLLNYFGMKISSYFNKIILILIPIVLAIYIFFGFMAVSKEINGAEFRLNRCMTLASSALHH
ncbi:hypothetical protein [Peribacillus muralis]|uniref:hypothetical protein n=1 Tax=Peribacillus muralis TaxID=264697 RepID=UPI000A6041D7|nr:hypothetical protein [Peribacillus muralis]